MIEKRREKVVIAGFENILLLFDQLRFGGSPMNLNNFTGVYEMNNACVFKVPKIKHICVFMDIYAGLL